MQCTVNIVVAKHASPCGKRPGAVKSTYKKMQILRAKHCLSLLSKYSHLRIRLCESHADHVNRINTTELLKLISKEKEYVIMGNGVVRSREELKKLAAAREAEDGEGGHKGGSELSNQSDSSSESDDDGSGSEASDEEATSDRDAKSTSGSVSDNGGTTKGDNRKKPTHDLKASQNTPKPPEDPAQKCPSCPCTAGQSRGSTPNTLPQ